MRRDGSLRGLVSEVLIHRYIENLSSELPIGLPNFCLACHGSRVFASSSDWFIMLLAAAVNEYL